jgi:hypothetical protein
MKQVIGMTAFLATTACTPTELGEKIKVWPPHVYGHAFYKLN